MALRLIVIYLLVSSSIILSDISRKSYQDWAMSLRSDFNAKDPRKVEQKALQTFILFEGALFYELAIKHDQIELRTKLGDIDFFPPKTSIITSIDNLRMRVNKLAGDPITIVGGARERLTGGDVFSITPVANKGSWCQPIDEQYIEDIRNARKQQKAKFDEAGGLDGYAPGAFEVQFYVEPTAHRHIVYPFEARFKKAPGEDSIKFDRERIVDVEGYWAVSATPSEDSYKGKYPFPCPEEQTNPALEEFVKKLARIEKVAEDQFKIIPQKIGYPSDFVVTRARIVVTNFRGPHNRIDKGMLPGGEYVDRVSMIAWQTGVHRNFNGVANGSKYVKPSREFYRYVMNFPEAELQKMEKTAPGNCYSYPGNRYSYPRFI